MSSINLSQRRGRVPPQLARASISSFPIKRLAQVGATGVPIAIPFTCLNVLPANRKVLPAKIILSISLSMAFLGKSADTGGSVGIACWRAMEIPASCGMDGYKAFTSNVARITVFLASGGIFKCSMMRMTSPVDETRD